MRPAAKLGCARIDSTGYVFYKDCCKPTAALAVDWAASSDSKYWNTEAESIKRNVCLQGWYHLGKYI